MKRLWWYGTAIGAAVGLALAGVGAAASGDLDPSFGIGGVATTDVGGWETGYSSALQADGKIVMAGTSDQGGERRFALARYLADGSLDQSFGSGGKLAISAASADRPAVTVQPDGKIVLAGRGASGLVVYRLQPDGTFDAGFGAAGTATVPVSGAAGVAGVEIDADGNIVVGQAAISAAGPVGVVAVRLTPGGALDPSFGDGGKTEIFASFTRWPLAFDLQSDGKPVFAGYTTVNFFNVDIFVLRLTRSGAPDSEFGTDGEATIDVAGQWDEGQAIAIQSDGAVVVGGRSYTAVFGNTLWAFARLTSNGELDDAFGVNGRVTLDPSTGDDVVLGLASAGGKILATGQAGPATDLPLARLNGDGSIDTGFGTNGIAGQDVLTGLATAWNLLVQPDGKALTTGDAFTGNETLGDFVLVRYLGAVPGSDTTPPTIACGATPSTLWPPNHKLWPISVDVSASDDSGSVAVTLASVASSQPDSGLDPEDVPNDIQGWDVASDDTNGLLRAERFRQGRTYTLTYQAEDPVGNGASCETTVHVPKSQNPN